MFNRRNDYALCQLIGMTKRDFPFLRSLAYRNKKGSEYGAFF